MNCYAPPIGCGREITSEEFLSWDRLSQKEFEISGLCKTPCQDEYFTDEEWDELLDEVPCNCMGLVHRNDCPNWVMPF